MTTTDTVPSVPARSARRAAKRLRKQLKRVRSLVRSGGYWLTNNVSSKPVTGNAPVVVSLTTYGTRIHSVALAIESIADGDIRPHRLILWLDDDLVLPSGNLPASLLRLQRRGLEIQVNDNVGPHGKYFGYVTSRTHHDFPLVTADDDILYPRRWLKMLYDAHQAHPREVNCHWAKRMETVNGRLAGYATWPAVTDTNSGAGNFALGVSGVIYPVHLLDELARRGPEFESICPKADDIWLHWVALQTQTRIRQVSKVAHHFPMIPGTQSTGLRQANVADGGNDECLQRLYSGGDVQSLNV